MNLYFKNGYDTAGGQLVFVDNEQKEHNVPQEVIEQIQECLSLYFSRENKVGLKIFCEKEINKMTE